MLHPGAGVTQTKSKWSTFPPLLVSSHASPYGEGPCLRRTTGTLVCISDFTLYALVVLHYTWFPVYPGPLFSFQFVLISFLIHIFHFYLSRHLLLGHLRWVLVISWASKALYYLRAQPRGLSLLLIYIMALYIVSCIAIAFQLISSLLTPGSFTAPYLASNCEDRLGVSPALP